MFTIYAGDRLLWSEMSTEPQYALIDPVVKTEINKTGSLEFTILDSHVLYDQMIPFGVEFVVYEDDEVFFEGRLIDTSTSFFNERKVVAEGIMGYLNDTYVAPRKTTETPAEHFRRLIQEHNSQCEPKKRFEIGEVTVTDSLGRVDFKSEGYRNTKSAIDNDLVEPYKAFIRVRRVGDKHYIDLLKELSGEGSQQVRFAYNLLDMTDEDNAEEVFSVIVPVGKNNLTVASVNNNSKEIKIDDLFDRYGRIVKIVQFSDVSSAATLMTKAREWIEQNVTNRKMRSFSVTALDMARLGYENESFEVGKKYRIVSEPNGIEELTYLKTINLHLAELDETTYEFGDPDPNGDSRGSISSAAASISQTLTISNDYLRGYISVNDRNMEMMGKKLGINFDDITIEGGEVHFSGVTFLEAIFNGMGINAEDAEGIEGQFRDFSAKIEANSEHLQIIYEELRKTALDPTVTGWDGVIEQFASKVTQTASSLAAEVRKTETYINGNEREMATFRTFMEQTPTDWTVFVQRNEDISSLIRLDSGGVTIQGGIITLDADTILATVLEANTLSSTVLNVGGITAGPSTFSENIVVGTAVTAGGWITASEFSLPDATLIYSEHRHTITADDDGTVTIGAPTDEESSANFNIADTNFFREKVSAAELRGFNSVKIEERNITLRSATGLQAPDWILRVGVDAEASNGRGESATLEVNLKGLMEHEKEVSFNEGYIAGAGEAGGDQTDISIDTILVTDAVYDPSKYEYALTISASTNTGVIGTTETPYKLNVKDVYDSVVVRSSDISVTGLVFDADDPTALYGRVNVTASNGNTVSKAITVDTTAVWRDGMDVFKRRITVEGAYRHKDDIWWTNGRRVNVYAGVTLRNPLDPDWSYEFKSDAITVNFGDYVDAAKAEGVTEGIAQGKNSVTLSSTGWMNGKVTVSASNGKTYDVTLPTFTVSGGTTFNADHITKVFFSTASVNAPVKEATVDASSVWQAGQTAFKQGITVEGAYRHKDDIWWTNGRRVNVYAGVTLRNPLDPDWSYEFKSDAITVNFGDYVDAAKAEGVTEGIAQGKNSVTLSSTGWMNGKVTVSASNGKTYDVALPAFTVSGGTTFNADHITKVFFSTASVNAPVKEATVDASSVWQAGYNAGKAEASTGGNASNISLGSFIWIPAAAGTSPLQGRTRLSALGSLIGSNKNSDGYILFSASINGGTGTKTYYIPMGNV